MILGALSFSSDSDASSTVKCIRNVSDDERLQFHPVSQVNFTGGFYLHGNLPYTTANFCYFDEKGDNLVLLSGAVYNRQELSRFLNLTTVVPDPELISLLFLKAGPGFASMLNGDFAIFILQSEVKQAYLFRDQVGIRPMAWALESQVLSFSSDYIGLSKAFSDGCSIEDDYLAGYFKYIDYRKTPNRKVRKLPPGSYLHFSGNRVENRKYWHPGRIRTDKRLKYAEVLSDLKEILTDAIQVRCEPGYTGGAHVSSGLDSGIVAGLAKDHYARQAKFYGFSWSPQKSDKVNAKYDERDLINRFCEKAGITPVFSDMSPDLFTQAISSLYGNPALFYEDRTVEQASGLGINLLLSGWGGDEFISTGDRGVEQDLLASLKLKTFFRRNPVRPFRKFINNQLQYVFYPALGVFDKSMAKSFRDDARYLRKPFRRSDRVAIRRFFFHTSRRQMHLGMLQFYHLQRRCENWMVNGYRHGVEYRYPLLDRRIIEYMLKVPSDILCITNQFRPLLRELGKGILTEEIRLNISKTDPVSWSYTRDLYRTAALSYMGELGEWKANPDLGFLDLSQLARDIDKYNESGDNANDVSFFKALVTIKVVHEFTKRYRESD